MTPLTPLTPQLIEVDVPRAESRVGRRVFEVFFMRDPIALQLMHRGVLKAFNSADAAMDALIKPWKGSAEEAASEKE